MKRHAFGIAEGGEQRLREAVEAQVRRRHDTELSAATDNSQKTAIERTIQREIKEEMGRIASLYSLWSSQ